VVRRNPTKRRPLAKWIVDRYMPNNLLGKM
jgi:hypothetical protein